MDLQSKLLLPIAQLQPSVNAQTSAISGAVSLIWPYSASRRCLSILLVEPDFRLRRRKGQVRITFLGTSAKAIARLGLISGDKITLALSGVEWVGNDTATEIPGRTIDWELQYHHSLCAQVRNLASIHA